MLRIFRPRPAPSEPADPLPSDAVWIDLFNPTSEEEKLVERSLGLEVPTREEMSEIEPSSRLYQEKDAVFLTANIMSGIDAGDPVSTPITFVLTSRHLVTIRYADPRPFRTFISQLEREPQQCVASTMTLIGLLDAIIDRLADTLEVVQADIDRTSRKVFRRGGEKDRRSRRMSNEELQMLLLGIGNDQDLLAKTRDSLVGMGRLLSFLSLPEFVRHDKAAKEHVKTLSRDIASLLDQSTYLSTNISFLLDASLGLINIEQNAIIKIFSVAAVVFLPPTLVASIYGMNFRHMPELDWTLGYPVTLGLMFGLDAWLWMKFRKTGWL